jgi:hypothetical protein
MSRWVVEDLRNISVFKLKEWSYLENRDANFLTGFIEWKERGSVVSTMCATMHYEQGEATQLDLSYSTKDGEQSFNPKLTLSKTPCYYGKSRYWLQCPRCDKRCAKLYFYEFLPYCRACLNLSYESNNRSKAYRYMDTVFGPIFNDELQNKLSRTKRYYYAGNPTKTYRKLLKQTVTVEDFERYQQSFRGRGRPKRVSY